MKFSHSLQLNINPQWTGHYIDYSKLKKLTYILEKAVLGLGEAPTTSLHLQGLLSADPNLNTQVGSNADTIPLLIDVHSRTTVDLFSLLDANKLFTQISDEELSKIIIFYTKKEVELSEGLDDLILQITLTERYEEANLHSIWIPESSSQSSPRKSPKMFSPNSAGIIDLPGHEPVDDKVVMVDDISRSRSARSNQGSPSSFLFLIWSSSQLKLKRKELMKVAVDLFVSLCELRDYVELNETGFSKLLKKYEKVMGTKLKAIYMEKIETEYPFTNSTKSKLEETIQNLIQWYSRIATDGKIKAAQSDLKSHLREHIVWERNTIWRDMVEQERRYETIGFVPNTFSNLITKPKHLQILFYNHSFSIPRPIISKALIIVSAILVLIILTHSNIFVTQEQNNCFAILIFSSILWATEAIPLFVTSIFIPFLVVSLRVMNVDGIRLDAKSGAKLIFSDMFGPVIMLLLGGFTLASALSKHGIAKVMASIILEKAGKKPYAVLIANMFVSTFASMWISNVAAPVLCFSLISPILRTLPHQSPYARCLVIGIAMAANVGGMASPIASPQNAIAMGIMNPPPSWIEWFLIALPVCVCLDLSIWAVLLLVYQPVEMVTAPPELSAHRGDRNFNLKQYYIIAISVITILLWCLESSIEGIVGDMGVIAILPIVAFFGFGILTKDDWNSLLWSVVMLAMGGIALGKAVESSGLLHEIARHLTPLLQDLTPFYCLSILSAIVVVVTSFISHTVGALIILPVVAQIGSLLPDPKPRMLVMASALMCSGGMCLPISSFPNMNAISLEDSRGMPWLAVTDFLHVGILSSIAALFLMVTVGYAVMILIDFQ